MSASAVAQGAGAVYVLDRFGPGEFGVTATRPFVVGLGGALRPGSTSERALTIALAAAAARGAETQLFVGQSIGFASYDTTVSARTPETLALMAALRRADGVIIASPSYHGSISGLVKNALDYVEDLRADVRPYFTDRAVGLIVCGEGVQGLGPTLAALRAIVHALRGWPTPYGVVINTGLKPFGPDGASQNDEISAQIGLVADQVVDFANAHRNRPRGAQNTVAAPSS
jgi:FMN reductase